MISIYDLRKAKLSVDAIIRSQEVECRHRHSCHSLPQLYEIENLIDSLIAEVVIAEGDSLVHGAAAIPFQISRI